MNLETNCKAADWTRHSHKTNSGRWCVGCRGLWTSSSFKVQTCGSHILSTLPRKINYTRWIHWNLAKQLIWSISIASLEGPSNINLVLTFRCLWLQHKQYLCSFPQKNPYNSLLIYSKIPNSGANSVQISMYLQFHRPGPQQKSIKQSSLSFQAWCKS